MDDAGAAGGGGGGGAETNGAMGNTNGTGAAAADGGGGPTGAADSNGTGGSGGSSEEAAFGSLIGSGGGGGGGGGGTIMGTAADMIAKMTTTHWGLGWKVVPALLEAAKKYKLTLTEPGAEAIYAALTGGEVSTLADEKATDAAKLKVLRTATKRAIDDPKNADVKKELQKLVADVDKQAADAGTPP